MKSLNKNDIIELKKMKFKFELLGSEYLAAQTQILISEYEQEIELLKKCLEMATTEHAKNGGFTFEELNQVKELYIELS
jgi:hypothetical protein